VIWEIGTVLKHVVLPPLGFAWLFVLAWLLLRRRPRTARWLLGTGLLLCYGVATPLVNHWLLGLIRVESTPLAAKPQAIVVLGAGRGLIIDASDQVLAAYPSAAVLERLLTGAQLQKQTGLPLLVTGGSVDGRAPSEGAVMQASLVRDFGVPVRWVEQRSRNTVENAQFSAPMLKAAGVNTVLLVTHEDHMRRARMLFEAQGISVVPFYAQSPVPGDGLATSVSRPLTWRDLWPTAGSLGSSFLFFNEVAGIAYARVLAWTSGAA
jgi:uncharacterized SAM-binding protein YcdF (DUF218 family)